jgi:pimeloyl-ACP methyl ester carboxylesterase
LPWQNVEIAGKNGKFLRGWYIPAGRRVMLLMHGWGGNAATLLPLAASLHTAGYSLLLLDARCHGESDDDTFASLPRFAEDIESGLDWLAQRPEIDPGALGLAGHSVGAGGALLVASRRHDIGAVLSISAFAHPAAMMRRWLLAKRIPYWPLGAYILTYVQAVIGHRFDDIAPCHTIAQVGCPVMLVHGVADATVPITEARQIRDAGAQVELLEVAGCHEDFGDVDVHLPQVLAFLDAAFAGRNAGEKKAGD